LAVLGLFHGHRGCCPWFWADFCTALCSLVHGQRALKDGLRLRLYGLGVLGSLVKGSLDYLFIYLLLLKYIYIFYVILKYYFVCLQGWILWILESSVIYIFITYICVTIEFEIYTYGFWCCVDCFILSLNLTFYIMLYLHVKNWLFQVSCLQNCIRINCDWS